MRRVLPVVWTLVVLVGCGGTNAGDAAPTSSVRPSSSPVSGLVDIGDRSLFLDCQGAGEPTVVLEAGLTGDRRTWESVLPAVAAKSRVCAYDRANIGRSDTAPGKRTTSDMVADLRALLAAADEEPPYVLAGFSFGGLAVQQYAATYPDEVAGLVLVESNHPDEVEQFQAHLTPAQIAEDRAAVKSNPEGVDVYASFAEVRSAGPLPDVPLVVVTAGISAGWPPGWDPELFDRLHAQQQADLVTLVPDGTQVIARNSAHEVPLQQPAVVVKAVGTVLAALN